MGKKNEPTLLPFDTLSLYGKHPTRVGLNQLFERVHQPINITHNYKIETQSFVVNESRNKGNYPSETYSKLKSLPRKRLSRTFQKRLRDETKATL